MLKENEKMFSEEETEKMMKLFNKRGYSLTYLDLLDEAKEQYCPKKMVLQLIKNTRNYVETNTFINELEKEELELQLVALNHFTRLITKAA